MEKEEEQVEEASIRVSRSTKRVGVRSKRSVSVGRRGSKSAIKRNQWIDDKEKPHNESFGKLPVPGLNFQEIAESTPPPSTDDRSEGGSRKSRKMIKAGPGGIENLQELVKVEENRRINLRGNPTIKQLTKSRSHESFKELMSEWQEHQKCKGNTPKITSPVGVSIGSRGPDSNQSAPLSTNTPAFPPPPASLFSHSANLSLKGSLPSNPDINDLSPPPRTERLVISFEELEHYKALINLNVFLFSSFFSLLSSSSISLLLSLFHSFLAPLSPSSICLFLFPSFSPSSISFPPSASSSSPPFSFSSAFSFLSSSFLAFLLYLLVFPLFICLCFSNRFILARYN